jgi:cytochrome c556
MPHFTRLTVAVVLAVVVMGGTASAVNAPEHVIKYRQNLMKSAGAHLANVVLTAQGRVDFADGLVTDSQAIVDLLENSSVAFPEGTAEGDTRAKAKIWEERAKFDAAMEESLGTVRELAAAAKAGDLAAVNAALVPVARGCRSCHLSFRVRN